MNSSPTTKRRRIRPSANWKAYAFSRTPTGSYVYASQLDSDDLNVVAAVNGVPLDGRDGARAVEHGEPRGV
eukprot:CAMPEP_0198672614 /NCGR_PEP_ID=MMETSP1467-20131203/91931_1 /TAXON_ID=1462469 /ORGANISM="unid. sp., Strain CCMP2135" /LENGTH=70 /DNA_ID=CAMNT_0044409451 /DNA_START=40 /DNA_END=251 /DNA_ORIENTATION=-